MLFQLNIMNMALIKELNIEFEERLNVLTGETGAGKSIIIEAIDLILGGSAASDLIRDGEDSLVVEGLFLLAPQEKELISNLNSDMEIVDKEVRLSPFRPGKLINSQVCFKAKIFYCLNNLSVT